MLKNIENRVSFKNLPDDSELRHDSIPWLRITELSDSSRLIVRDGGEIFVLKPARELIKPYTTHMGQQIECCFNMVEGCFGPK